MDKQKKWKIDGDLESIREYNRWKATTWRKKHKIDGPVKLLTDKEKRKKEVAKNWYILNKEYLSEKYYKQKNHIWIDMHIDDRNFVLNFNPKDYPKYLEALSHIKHSLIIRD